MPRRPSRRQPPSATPTTDTDADANPSGPATAPREADATERLRRQLARGTVELAILSVLGAGRRYGYELLTVLNQLTGGMPEVKEGTLYPLLHRLEDAGQITSTWEAEGRTPPRKYYLLTPSGKEQLVRLRGEWGRLVAGMQRLLDAMEGTS